MVFFLPKTAKNVTVHSIHALDCVKVYAVVKSMQGMVIASDGKYKGFAPENSKEVPKAARYTSWERANLAFRWVYGHCRMHERYDATDEALTCEEAVSTFLEHLYSTPNSNPLTQKYPTYDRLQVAFDLAYPKAS